MTSDATVEGVVNALRRGGGWRSVSDLGIIASGQALGNALRHAERQGLVERTGSRSPYLWRALANRGEGHIVILASPEGQGTVARLDAPLYEGIGGLTVHDPPAPPASHARAHEDDSAGE